MTDPTELIRIARALATAYPAHDSRDTLNAAADALEGLSTPDPNPDRTAKLATLAAYEAPPMATDADGFICEMALQHGAEMLNDDGTVYAFTQEQLLAYTKANRGPAQPIDMLLFCPNCGRQHIDAPEEHWDRTYVYSWENPPHRSHLCHHCAHIWRPADVPTNGVQAITTRGKADSVAVLPVRTGMLFGPREAVEHQELQERADRQATEINHLRNVIQAACTGGTGAMIKRWVELFPDAPVPTVHHWSGPARPPIDPAGEPKIEMTLVEREAVKLLNSLKAAADGGMLQLSEGVQMQIDVILMTASQRRVGVA